MLAATMADRVSLSPMLISSVEMVSFSLMMGSAPSSNSRSKVTWKFSRRRPPPAMSGRGMSSWATVWLYSVNSLSYVYISSH